MLPAVLTLLFVLQPALGLVDALAPGQFFEYDYNAYVDQGAGGYEGYSDAMRSHSRYAIVSAQGDNVTVQGQGSWTYEASDGTRRSGSLDIIFTFSMPTRRYLNKVDVEGNYSDPAVWFWVPAPLDPSKTVRILDATFTIQSLDSTLWLGSLPHKAVLLESSGTYHRDDAYGSLQASYDDRYYFDRTTGFIAAESYEEHDSNATASFRYRAEVTVTASSHVLPLDWATFSAIFLGIPGAIGVGLYSIWRFRRGPRWVTIRGAEGPARVVLRRTRRPSRLDGLIPGCSRFFGPFLVTFARRALASRDPIVIAKTKGTLVGLLILDREAGLGSLFAADSSVARRMLSMLPVWAFFVDIDNIGGAIPGREVDTFQILELKDPRPMPYDTAVVRPMTVEDLAAVDIVAQTVYQGTATAWISRCFEGGDLAFVATVEGQIVGFGFTTVVDTSARFHTLTVLPRYQGRGLGSEIMAARMTAVASLGVETVIVEVSKNNTASLIIARRAGFEVVGRTAYYTKEFGPAGVVPERRM